MKIQHHIGLISSLCGGIAMCLHKNREKKSTHSLYTPLPNFVN